ncbi:vacuolar transporter chaperone [Coniosporium tulheliwenetii]|uniref:Vacuolar transporter chaperone n=1 Tax=Coniosporium tulheliwenetii TaxID=3383036 RepID=A0ACC2ZNK3_9PEZI|nr:vacuolar transporter chaperone [Cladosporium sp. JES 115]
MRFGQQLRTSLIKDWYYYYIDYDGLKQSLKKPYKTEPTPDNPEPEREEWTEEDEQRFVKELEQELDKVFTFQKVKSQEIVRRIKASEKEVNEVIARADQQAADEPRSGQADVPTEEDFMLLEEDLSDIIADVHDLAKFTQLNYTGFQKIIKKHDKQTEWHLKPVFAARLRAKPFFKDNYDAFIVKLSRLYDLHLPVLVFNASKEFDPKDSAISSIYYDNTDTWELYTGRLKKTEGAEAIRLRWYGDMSTDTIFVERKTHREDWTGEKSVKARFSLKEKNVNDFMHGRLTVDKVFEKMRKEGKKNLVPVTRSFYNRTAFQLPGDARVRISLDTELTMTREDNLDGRQRAGDNWRRMDIGIDYPFPQLPPEDVERFPHLVEAVPKFSKFIHGTAKLHPGRIKLLPYWMPQMDVDIRKPISHRFGIERPGQSQDVSTSANYDDDSDEEDNLAVPDGDTTAPRHEEEDNDNENLRRLREARDAMEQHDLDQRADYGAMDGQADGQADGSPNSLDIEERIAARPLQNSEDYPLYDSDDEEDDLEEARRAGGWTYRKKLLQLRLRRAGEWLGGVLKKAVPAPQSTSMPRLRPSMGVPKTMGEAKRFKAPKGKRIHVPVRVEPKVFFAAERTFLSWLEFSIILGSIAATLLNFGDNVSLASAWAFTIVACLSLLYSMGLYLWRSDMIRKRRAVTYHDKWGPSILCVGLFAAVAVSFGMRLSYGGDGGGLKG